MQARGLYHRTALLQGLGETTDPSLDGRT